MPGSPENRLLASARNLVFEIVLGEIQKRLAADGISILVLKGPHVATALYDDPADRFFCDLDVLVLPEHYVRAARVLLADGFQLLSQSRRRLASEKADYQLLMLSPRGVAVELHRALADTSQFRSDVAGFFARAENFVFGELPCRGLATEDLLLHLCLHFGKRHFMTSEKKHLLDIALLVKNKHVDWPVFLKRVQDAGCRTATHYCFEAARLQHGAPIPATVLAALRPGLLRRRLLGRFLDTSAFPLYRHAGRAPGARERFVNMVLLDGPRALVSSVLWFSGRKALDRLLLVRPLRQAWLKRHPLNEWLPQVR